MGDLSRTRRRPLPQSGEEICAQGLGLLLHVRTQRRLRRRRQTRLQREAVLASRQHRRHAVADHSSGLDHPPAAHRRAESPGRRRPRRRPPFDRARGQGRHHRRSRARIGRGLSRGRRTLLPPHIIESTAFLAKLSFLSPLLSTNPLNWCTVAQRKIRAMNEEALVDAIFELALPKEDGEIDAERKHTLWVIGTVILADVLLRTRDEFTKERLLRGVQGDLRQAIAMIPTIQRTGTLN